VKLWKQPIALLAGALMLACLMPGAAAPERGEAPRLTLAGPAAEAPVIDGRLDDACWHQAAQTTGFVLNDSREAATEQTTVYVTYDSAHLYVAFECLESQMDEVRATVTERDGPIFKDDVVELFLDPNQDRFTYYQFAVNVRGTRFDLRGDAAGTAPHWDAPWNAATTRGSDRWWAEFAIPFSSLELHVGKTGDTWGINFAREQKPKGELSVWSYTGGAFGRPDRFGQLSGLAVDFSRYAYSIEVADSGERLIGNNVLKARVSSPFGGKALVDLALYLPDGQPQVTSVRTQLNPQTPATVTLPYSLPREGFYRPIVRVRDPNTRQVLRAVVVPITVPPILELALYPNHYRQEVMLRPRLNVRQEDLSAFRLTARLLKNGTLVPPVREKPFFVAKEPVIPFDLSKSGPGEYEIHVTLTPKRSGGSIVRDVLRFEHMPLSSKSVPPVSIDADNTLLVRGKRFFPIGIYRYGNFTEHSLRELSESGFNLVQAPYAAPLEELREVVDRIHAHKMMTWIPFGPAIELPENDEAKRQKLGALVKAMADHPALLCWESVDEPAWTGSNAADLYRGYRVVRRLDPDHPVWMNHAPRNTVDELALFNHGADVAGADIYPVPEPQTQSDLPNKTIAVVGDETSKNVLAVLNRKPIFMVLQGFAWADLSRRRGGTEKPIYPSFQQSRFMAYHAIVRGARGLLFWGVNYTPKPSPFWNSLRQLAYELSQMHDVLAGPDTGEVAKVHAGGKAIETLIRRHCETDQRFIIAVNASPEPVDARIEIPRAMPKVSWRVLFEDRRITGNPIVDHFEPWDVHIYTGSLRFPQEKRLELPPVTQVQRPRPEDLLERGNLLVNPGFEFTEDGEESPIGWSLRPAFYGGVSREVKRSGRYSVFLKGRDATSKPLWLQTGIATETGRRYRFTAQVRTEPAGADCRIYAEWTDAAGKYLGGSVPAQWSAGTAQWQPLTLDFMVNHPDAKKLYVVLQVRGQAQAWFDDVKLEEMR